MARATYLSGVSMHGSWTAKAKTGAARIGRFAGDGLPGASAWGLACTGGVGVFLAAAFLYLMIAAPEATSYLG